MSEGLQKGNQLEISDPAKTKRDVFHRGCFKILRIWFPCSTELKLHNLTKATEAAVKHKLFPGLLYLQVFKQPWVKV